MIIFIQKDDQGKTMGRVSRALSSETRWQSLFSRRVLILSEKSTQFTFFTFVSESSLQSIPTTNVAFLCKNLQYFVLKSWQRYPWNSSPSIDKIDILAHWVVIVVSPRATLSRWCGLRWLEEVEEVDDRFGEIRKAKRARGGVPSTCWRIGEEGGTFLQNLRPCLCC